MFGLPGPITALGIALLLSLGANAVAVKAYLSARDRATVAVTDRDSERAAASACSDSVEALADLAGKRAKESAEAVAAARQAAKLAQSKAQRLLTATPAVPGDDCRSAAVQMDSWLTDRKAGK